jgi:hypothetical protein
MGKVSVMNILAVLIVGSPLMATAGVPIVVGHPAPLLVAGAPVQLAANDDFTARKDDYLQKSRSEMDEWRNKIHGAGENAEAKGHEMSASARAHFNRTWTAAQRNWRKLQTERAEGWDKVKSAYERSTAELREQWHKIHPEDKD